MRPKTSTAANDGAAERKKIPRKDKIRRLAEREAERERGGRLECVIVQKLSLKHGPRSSGPVSRQLIAGVAKKYLKERPHLAGSTDIRRVGPIVDQVSAEVVKVAALRQAAGEPKMEEVTNKKPPQKESRDHLSTPELSKDTDTESWKKVNPWTAIATYQVLQAERTKSTAKETAIQRRKVMATVLNEQIRVKNQCEREKQLEEEKFLALQTQKSTEWKIEQETVKRKDREKSINLGRLRQHQINKLKELKLDNNKYMVLPPLHILAKGLDEVM